jgi:hypothetical protein
VTAPLRQAGLRIWLDGRPLDRVTDWVLQVEVDERCDEASTLRLTVDMSPVAGDWDVLEHGSFAAEHAVPDFRLLRRVTVQLGLALPGAAEQVGTVFDGYITAVEPVFGEARVPDSRLVLTGMDASCLMHLETVTRTWADRTDAQIAAEIFTKYGFTVRGPAAAGSPAAATATVEDGGLDRPAARGALVQRGTDAEFLRVLARRNGYETYLEPAPGPVREGTHPASAVEGHFHPSRVDAPEQPALALFPRDAPSLIEFRARYDSMAPTRFLAWHLDERDRRIRRVDVADPGYGRMGSHSRADVLAERLAAIQPVRSPGGSVSAVDIVSADVPHGDVELAALTRGELRLGDWFAAGTGTVLTERYPVVVRPRRPIGLTGAGHLLDGRWYVQAVRHRWGIDPDQPEVEQPIRRYEADVTLVRNALGGSG